MPGPCHAFCNPIPAGVTFGDCDMALGIAATDSGCISLSGCSSIGSDGYDYTGYFYDLMQECEAACGGNSIGSKEQNVVYPNPTKDIIQLDRNYQLIQVVNAFGQVVLKYNNTKSINLISLPAGIYHLELQIDSNTKFVKIIKEN
jgi:hypothetical protein